MDPPARAGRGRPLRPGAHGDPLHPGRHRRLHLQFGGRASYLGGLPIIGGATVTVGASAPIFGLLGALVYYGRRTGSRHIGQAGLQYALFMGIFGLIMPGVDNQAHLGGFIGGYLGGLLLDPLKPERIDHWWPRPWPASR